MFYLIEVDNQLNEFKSKKFDDAFIEIIPFNNNIHPVLNKISLIYIHPLNEHKGYIISIDHSEALKINFNNIKPILESFNKIYVRDKKEFLHFFILKNLYDLTLNENYNPVLTKTHNFFYNKFSNKKDINRIIPISKHYEYCEKIFNDLKDKINEPINQFFNNKVSLVFNAIERVGLRIQPELFQSKFHDIDGEFTYSQYNFKTTTTRPSNKFNGINYAALNKQDNTREIFIPRNDKLVEIDIRAYHPTLLSKMIGYSFLSADIHQEFANMYGVDYNKAKEITFQQLYGGIFPQYKNLEFFKKVQEFTDKIWDEYNTLGEINVPISNYCFKKDKLKNMNPPKLLNYILQALETANNTNILWDMFKILKGKNTKLILYTFDSFLFDLDKSEKQEFKQILGIFDKYNLHTKIAYGDNYNF